VLQHSQGLVLSGQTEDRLHRNQYRGEQMSSKVGVVAVVGGILGMFLLWIFAVLAWA
jgi:hypothetical protein